MGTLIVSKLEVLGIESELFANGDISTKMTPFYISLYLTNNIIITDNDLHKLNYTVVPEYSSFTASTLSSSSNLYWNNNSFIVPLNGIYSINYSIMGKINSWINKGDNYNNISNRFSMNFNNNIYSSSCTLNTIIGEKWSIIVNSQEASIQNPIIIHNSYENYGETKINIILLQKT